MTLIQAQQRLIDRVNHCHPDHRRRVINGAASELRAYLTRIGVPMEQHRAIVRDAIDMVNLEAIADEE
jgi:hypothetical protein